MAIGAKKPDFEGYEKYVYEISRDEQQVVIAAFVEGQIEAVEFEWEEGQALVTAYGGKVNGLE